MTPTSLYEALPNNLVERVDVFAGLMCLALASVVGLALGTLRGRATRWLGLAGLCGLLELVWSQWVFAVALAGAQYWAGTARMLVEPPGNPDPTSRIPQRSSASCCGRKPGWNDWSNQTLDFHVALFGASPNAYRGPYPDKAMAGLILATSGEVPTLRGQSQLAFSSGEVFELYVITPQSVRRFKQLNPGRIPYSAELSNLDITRGDVRRVAYLSPTSILAETETRIELRAWDRFHTGNAWASWSK